jgi:arylsulfatase A-like enzyme
MNNGHQTAFTAPAGLGADSKPAESRAGRPMRAELPNRVAREGIWPRIGLLFLALCLVKLALLFGLRKHLFEIHWRVGGEPNNWVNEAGFYVFAGLVGLHVWKLGTRCMAAGKEAIHVANACVLALGAALILLTAHEGEKNWLSPVMNGVLAWKDLGWYVAMDFCFRPPFLGAWILLYALAYYVLARLKRSDWILRITAICAGLYVALCLRDFRRYHNALVIVDCVGVACLLVSWRAGRSLGLGWISLFVLGAGFIFGLFYGLEARLSFAHADPEFVVLTGTGLVLVAGVSLLAWRLGFWRGWSWMAPFALTAFVLLLNINYGLAGSYQKLLCTGFTLPRYFLGEFVVAAVLFVLALGYRRWRPAGSLLWLDSLVLILVASALADLRLSQIMGVRLDWQALSLALGETPRMMWRMARPYLPALLCALTAVIALYATLLWALRRGRLPPATGSRTFSGARFLLLSFLMLGVAGERLLDHDKAEGQSTLLLAETSPLWRRTVDPAMSKEAFISMAQSLGMNQLVGPQTVPLRPERDLNVVLIFQESSYNKYLSLFNGTEETQPLLSEYKVRMELFPNFYTSFAGSINARFATFTGLYPVQDYKRFTIERVGVQSVFEVLHDHGYNCSLFYSAFLDYTGFRDFLKGRKLDEVYDAETMPGERKTKPVSWGLREEETLGAMQAKIKRYAAEKQKFFLTYVPAAPHNPFDGTPPRFCKYQAAEMGDFTPFYLNELRHMDWIISSLIDQLKDCGVLDRTLVIITDDHGELLGGNGGPIGHGWAVTPELANIPLIIMDPGKPGYRVNYTVGSQVDLAPTILDLLGLAAPEGQLCQGDSLYSSAAGATRTIYLNSFQQYGIMEGQYMFCGNRGASGAGTTEYIFAITNLDARSFYSTPPLTNACPVSISDFDRFQASLLRHYSRYCELMRH